MPKEEIDSICQKIKEEKGETEKKIEEKQKELESRDCQDLKESDSLEISQSFCKKASDRLTLEKKVLENQDLIINHCKKLEEITNYCSENPEKKIKYTLDEFNKQLKIKTDFRCSNFEGLDFTMTQIQFNKDYDFSGANFNNTIFPDGTHFSSSTKFIGATFKNSRMKNVFLLNNHELTGTYFKDADIQGGDFRKTIAFFTHFEGVICKETNFSEAKLSFSVMKDAQCKEAMFIRTLLREVDFTRARLHGADFNSSNVLGAVFNGANVNNATFRNARWFPIMCFNRITADNKHYNLNSYNDIEYNFLSTLPNGSSFHCAPNEVRFFQFFEPQDH